MGFNRNGHNYEFIFKKMNFCSEHMTIFIHSILVFGVSDAIVKGG